MTNSEVLKKIPKLVRRSKFLIILTLLTMIATVILMTLRFSPVHLVLLIVQTVLLTSQVVCIKKLKGQGACGMTSPLDTKESIMSGRLTHPVKRFDIKIYLDGELRRAPLGMLLQVGNELMEVAGHHAEGLYVNRGMKGMVVECHEEGGIA